MCGECSPRPGCQPTRRRATRRRGQANSSAGLPERRPRCRRQPGDLAGVDGIVHGPCSYTPGRSTSATPPRSGTTFSRGFFRTWITSSRRSSMCRQPGRTPTQGSSTGCDAQANSELLTGGAGRSRSGRWSSKDFNGTGATGRPADGPAGTWGDVQRRFRCEQPAALLAECLEDERGRLPAGRPQAISARAASCRLLHCSATQPARTEPSSP